MTTRTETAPTLTVEPLPVNLTAEIEQLTSDGNIPFQVFVELTRRCNLVCSHCYRLEARERPELTLPEFESLFDDLASVGTLFLIFSGGEIFAHRQWYAIMKAARDRNFALSLLSNATLVTPEVAARIAEISPVEVGVSVYGCRHETHDAITGRAGSHARTIAGMKNLTAAGIKVAVKTPIFRSNLDEVDEIEAMARENGWVIRYDTVITPMDNGDVRPVELHRVRTEDLHRIYSDERWKRESAPEGEDHLLCMAGINYAAINAYGDVLPCVQMPIPAGNVRETRFSELWRQGQIFTRLRTRTHDALAECRTCRYKGYCQRCSGLAHVETGDIDNAVPSACEIAMAAYEVSTGLKADPPAPGYRSGDVKWIPLALHPSQGSADARGAASSQPSCISGGGC